MVITTYYINKEKRTVVCVMDTFNDVCDKIRKYDLKVPDKYYCEKKTFRGVAKCSPEDEWDEAVGKRLAERRAAAKRQNYVNNAIDRYVDKEIVRLNNLLGHGSLRYPNELENVEE